MITFAREGRRFVLRAAGVAIHRGRVLLHRTELDDFWALPGGRVEMGEPSREALSREMREELVSDVEVGRLLWVAEIFFDHQEERYHELGLIYSMVLPIGSELAEREEFTGEDHGVRLEFRWFPLPEIPELVLYPAFLKVGLRSLPETTSHVVCVDS